MAIRLAFLWWVAPLELWADEGQYVYQALAWNRFGFYLGSANWVWPPAYPFFLAVFLRLFAEDGLFAAKLAQVLLSGVVGASLVLLARRLFSPRAGVVAGVLWAVYLPLIGFTHYLWPETLFLVALLPAVLLFLSVVDAEEPDAAAAAWRVAGAGGLLGLAMLLKEAPLPLFVLLPALLLWLPCGGLKPGARVGLAGVLVLAGAAVVLPWTLRTYEVYGRLVPSGATLGENLYQGVNADYLNYDYAGNLPVDIVEEGGWVDRWFVRWPADAEKWSRSEAPNTIDRDSENAASAKAFALRHTGFYLRSRVKKLADWWTPLNFFQRHLRLGVYSHSPIGERRARRVLVVASVALTMAVLAGGLGGAFLSLERKAHAWTLAALLLTFLAGIAVVSMSRYRLPAEPFLLVLAAGLFAGERAGGARRRVLACGAWAVLAFCWTMNHAEVLEMLRRSLR